MQHILYRAHRARELTRGSVQWSQQWAGNHLKKKRDIIYNPCRTSRTFPWKAPANAVSREAAVSLHAGAAAALWGQPARGAGTPPVPCHHGCVAVLGARRWEGLWENGGCFPRRRAAVGGI